MAKTINQGFLEFLTKLTPSSAESEAVKSHRASIEACLKSNFTLKRFARIGSYGNGTSVSGYSDVDYLAVLATSDLKSDSSKSLTLVRDALDKRFPNTGVRVNCPAIAVPFGTSTASRTEVVVADYVKEDHSFKVYDIADCAGGWQKSSPDGHNAYVSMVDGKLGGKVKPLIRFIKAWKFMQSVPISSFYLELRVAKYASTQTSIVYDIDVCAVFRELASHSLAQMQDPMGISGYISPCSTAAKKTDALSKLATALTRAEKARSAEALQKTSEAFSWWDLVFAGQFPSY